MSVGGTTSVVLIDALVKAARAAGLDEKQLLRSANIDLDAIEVADARIPRASEHQLWAALVSQSGDEAFGLHLAKTSATSGQFGLLEYLIRDSMTLRMACEQVVQFLPILFDGDPVVYQVRPDDQVVFGYRRGPHGPPLTRHPEECAVAGFVLLVRRMLGSDWNPGTVLFEHGEPRDTREHEKLFRAPVRFGQALNGIVFPEQWLDRSSTRGDPRLLQFLQDYSSRLMEALPQTPPFTEQVRRIIVQHLPKQLVTVKEVARKLSMSVRSLQRRLDEEGRTFREVVEEEQLASALHLFQRGSRSVSEVAYLVGFNDQNAFSRFFKRMTGEPPSRG